MNDGGPAFPREAIGPEDYWLPGMSLRDWFAGQAMKTFLDVDLDRHDGGKSSGPVYVAIGAYMIADAMLEASEVKLDPNRPKDHHCWVPGQKLPEGLCIEEELKKTETKEKDNEPDNQ